ncbi:MAG: CBS domain-containing protein [Planctomycetota bacterium]|nr:CBS domain-containing protein [Planctomycetota bacterium]
MGDPRASGHLDDHQRRAFMRALLDDVRALEHMLDNQLFETGIRRIGAEQEMFLIGRGADPAMVAVEVLEDIADPAFTTELARFNLEANLPPYEFGGDCLRKVENTLKDYVQKARFAAAKFDADVFLTGILPTLQMTDLTLDNMTPVPRYAALNDAMVHLRGGKFRCNIKGTDEFYVEHDNVMLESCNTSFQVHFQVAPDEFARLYNLAQAVTAPVLAAAVNSPVLAEHRLWHETRVALFQHSVDDRSGVHLTRGQRPRVSFGDRWLDDSVLEIFREDIARYRVVLATDSDERPLEVLAAGGVPKLRALSLHNGTVYRWNRACYGTKDGIAHLRIENRVLPAGPSILDEVSNAAFYFGLMTAAAEEFDDIRTAMDFDDAKANFVAAARHGLRAQLTWTKGKHHTAADIIRSHLLPAARAGLESRNIDSEDVDRYLGVIEERVTTGRTGSQWMLDSLARMHRKGSPHSRCQALVAAAVARQKSGQPVHTWSLAAVSDMRDWRHSYKTVGQFMTRDLFTVQPDDLVDFAANLMDWEYIRHIPVEDADGRLVGLISHRTLIRLLAKGPNQEPVTVRDIMKSKIVCVSPGTPTLEAIEIMRRRRVGCLPVVEKGKLVGILTERDLVDVAAKLLDEQLRDIREP